LIARSRRWRRRSASIRVRRGGLAQLRVCRAQAVRDVVIDRAGADAVDDRRGFDVLAARCENAREKRLRASIARCRTARSTR
jgi:hypothetical protein